MKAVLIPFLVAAACAFSPAQAAPVNIAIDLDTSRTSGTATAGTYATQSGFTSWDVTTLATSGNTFLLDGVTFELFGFSAVNQSRTRSTGGGGGFYDALLTELVYNEGAQGRAIGLRIGGLDPGTYEMQSWHYDSTSTVTSTENFMRIEVRNQGQAAGEGEVPVTKQPFGLLPVSFNFQVSEEGQVKELIFREDDEATLTDPADNNRARLNGFTLVTVVPEPGSLSLLLLGAASLLIRRR